MCMPNERDMSTYPRVVLTVEHPRLFSDVIRGFIRVIRVPVCPMCPLCVPAPSGVLFTGAVRVVVCLSALFVGSGSRVCPVRG